jgi:hypothetical protein
MLAYYISGSNIFTFRTAPTSSQSLTLHLQDMMTLRNSSSSISPYTYNSYESMLSFTASISSSFVGDEYRAYITSGTSSIWNGSIQVYTSQSVDKANYENQIPLEQVYKSRVSTNEYIILD